jgi:molybdate transport system regulatory protein
LESLPKTQDTDASEEGAATAATKFLTTEQLAQLDQAFATWVANARGKRSRMSRNRCRLVFLMLRHTGAKLGEVLAVRDDEDFDLVARKVRLGGRGEEARTWREVYMPHELHAELGQLLRDADYAPLRGALFALDQGYVRRVLYERAAECGLPRHLANPNTLRRSRGIELLRGGVPLVAIQRSLGHLTANSTAAFLELSGEDTAALDLALLEREKNPTEDNRNVFSGKIAAINPGDLQSLVEVETPGGHRLVSVLSNDHLRAMGLRRGSAVTARIRPPRLSRDDAGGAAAGPNRFHGVVERIMVGADTAEVVVQLEDGARVCSVVTPESLANMRLEVGEPVWAMTGAFSITVSLP